MNERRVAIRKSRELIEEAARILVERGLEEYADGHAHYFLTLTGEDKDFRTVYIKGSIPKKLRDAVFERDGYICKKCGSARLLQADHIHPESKGGPTTLENLQTLCKKCNLKKGSKIE
jgi:HNH endonuclease